MNEQPPKPQFTRFYSSIVGQRIAEKLAKAIKEKNPNAICTLDSRQAKRGPWLTRLRVFNLTEEQVKSFQSDFNLKW